jgi:nicotinamidase/pyrazinamidase
MEPSDVSISRHLVTQPSDALIIVDVQNDFMPHGALPVAEADLIVPGINKLAEKFFAAGRTIVLTQDWHPPNHKSFASAHRGKKPYDPYSAAGIGPILWPDHCVQGTTGADFHPDLNTKCARLIIRKGFNPRIDSYSAFVENDKKTETGLSGYLRAINVKRVFVCGLALDYCVFYTALDGKTLGFDVVLVIDLTRPVGAPEGIVDRVLGKMTSKDVVLTNANQVSINNMRQGNIIPQE